MSAKSRRAARAAKDLSMYPRLFFNIVQAHHEGREIPPLKQPDGGNDPGSIARANQKLFSKFRRALMSNGHPHAISALDLICRVSNVGSAGQRGVYYLEFVPRGLAILADELRPSRGGKPLEMERGAPSPLRDERLDEPYVPGLDAPSEEEIKQQIANSSEQDPLQAFLEKDGKLNLYDADKKEEDKGEEKP